MSISSCYRSLWLFSLFFENASSTSSLVLEQVPGGNREEGQDLFMASYSVFVLYVFQGGLVSDSFGKLCWEHPVRGSGLLSFL